MMLLVGAVAVVCCLSIYAFYLWRQLQQQRLKEEQSCREIEELLQQKDREGRETIKIIATALLQGDMTDTEAAMRIAFFSNQIRASEEEQTLLSVFQQLAQATAHLPILEDWEMLERSEQKRLSHERQEIEARFSEFIKDSAEQLKQLH